jgi:hypothetical protein
MSTYTCPSAGRESRGLARTSGAGIVWVCLGGGYRDFWRELGVQRSHPLAKPLYRHLKRLLGSGVRRKDLVAGKEIWCVSILIPRKFDRCIFSSPLAPNGVGTYGEDRTRTKSLILPSVKACDPGITIQQSQFSLRPWRVNCGYDMVRRLREVELVQFASLYLTIRLRLYSPASPLHGYKISSSLRITALSVLPISPHPYANELLFDRNVPFGPLHNSAVVGRPLAAVE